MQKKQNILNSALIICTINRPELLIGLLHSLKKQTCLPKCVVVVDAGKSRQIEQEIDTLSLEFPIELRYLQSAPGLPLQRNQGLDLLDKLGFRESLEIVHFLDDDIAPPANYFESVFMGFAQLPEASCIGGFDSGLQPYPKSWARDLFMVGSDKTRGKILKSGIAVPLIPAQEIEEADWVPGHTQNFRASIIFLHRFDPSIRLYGEDIECQLRVSGSGPIYYLSSLGVEHFASDIGRDKYGEVQYRSDLFRSELVNRFPGRFSSTAVIWATLGLAVAEILTFVLGNNPRGLSGFRAHLKFLFQ